MSIRFSVAEPDGAHRTLGVMALLYQAELRPSKIELIAGWAPTQPWFQGNRDVPLVNVGAFRFDDPDGEVGMETVLVRAGDGPVLQVPLTYRAAPLDGAEPWLIGTMQHSVLGPRWVYDAVGDPVYLTAVATAALTGGHEAEQFVSTDGGLEPRASTAQAVGSGTPGTFVPALGTPSTGNDGGTTVVDAGTLRIVVTRVVVHPDAAAPAGAVLTGTWAGQPEPRTLLAVDILER